MSGLTASMVEFKANGSSAPGYLAYSDDSLKRPGLIVIQEWWGLEDHIKSVTRRMAEQGFVALAPDLYRGKIAAEPDEARKLAMELNHDTAVKDIQGAVNYLRDLPQVQPKQIGVMGFCMGGGLAGQMAFRGEHVGAVVMFYGGRLRLTDSDAAAVTAPVLGIYGEQDQSISPETIQNNESMLKKYQKPCEFIIYPGAPHAFFNDTRASYRPEAAADALQRTLTWFKKYLTD
ncbi:MAG: dienelactone hydrolase family protein [Chloroflexi bacterium]|nr:dienelactone hydrolase family protein [Chloroflexota bacterium]